MPNFIDSFQYTASDEINTSNPANVLLFVGEVPVPEDGIVNLPLFTVEGYNPTDIVTVQLSSAQGASLTLFDTSGVSFVSGNERRQFDHRQRRGAGSELCAWTR